MKTLEDQLNEKADAKLERQIDQVHGVMCGLPEALGFRLEEVLSHVQKLNTLADNYREAVLAELQEPFREKFRSELLSSLEASLPKFEGEIPRSVTPDEVRWAYVQACKSGHEAEARTAYFNLCKEAGVDKVRRMNPEQLSSLMNQFLTLAL